MSHGFIVPPIHIKDNLQLQPNEYVLLLKGVRIASAEVMSGHFLAMNPGTATESIQGVSTKEPAFGMPAIWITEEYKERAQIAGYTVVDCTTVIATHLSEVIKEHAHELIGRQEAQNLLDNVSKQYPKLVEELVPNTLHLGSVLKVLQNLLKENISIRDMRTILETLADYGPAIQDPDLLTEYVRQSLARQISNMFADKEGSLRVITLDHSLEEMIQKSIQRTPQGEYLAIDPQKAHVFLDNLNKQLSSQDGEMQPVLLCPPSIRLHVSRLTERYLPHLAVISHN
jgi:flagellar biosynthesis protein FlhA